MSPFRRSVPPLAGTECPGEQNGAHRIDKERGVAPGRHRNRCDPGGIGGRVAAWHPLAEQRRHDAEALAGDGGSGRVHAWVLETARIPVPDRHGKPPVVRLRHLRSHGVSSIPHGFPSCHRTNPGPRIGQTATRVSDGSRFRRLAGRITVMGSRECVRLQVEGRGRQENTLKGWSDEEEGAGLISFGAENPKHLL